MNDDIDDKLVTLLLELQSAKEHMRLARDLDHVVDNLHKLTLDEAVRLYNAVVARLVGS